jgi:hypothetical protein
MSDSLPPVNLCHRYIIRNSRGDYVSSTDDLGACLPLGYGLIDTVGTDGLGTVNGNKGIAAFMRARKRGAIP